MTAESVLAKGRARAESLHTANFDVLRDTGETTEDPETLQEVPVYDTIHAGIRGKFQSGVSQPREVEASGVKIADSALEWHCSIAVTGILTDDIVACLTSPTDPEYVGVRVRITGPHTKSYSTARRFPVERLT